ncbi:kinase-like protein [Leucogyrophana mollusca]|uniref:Kinase-like protein n=1 Tax=Leucogyrophana mollusca TaxID=85980 RepID=A0ACB8BL54_9AGAM|nr:kinase-like protein [Leucogyrophana mollusca]
MPNELDQKIQDVYKRIETERKVLEASQMLRQATTNQDVLRRTDQQIREAQRSLSYFEDTLRELQSRKKQQSQDSSRSDSPALSSPTTPRGGRAADRDRSLPPPPADSSGAPKGKQYTNLDLIKVDTPYTTAKISRMLHQLEFKLQVEMQYKKGIDKMAKLYQADGDKKSRADAESKRVESEKKIQLLQSALKRYKNLHILDDVEEEEEPPDGPGQEGERKGNLRAKPISGKLHVTIKGARELDHAPIVTAGRSRSSSKQISETYVSLKIEGTQRARSHPSRTDRWNEDFEITVDKANEVEIAVYDKQVSEPHPVPIGLLWVTISDLVEALRRQKVMMESGQGGWVTAGAMDGDSPTGRMPPQMGAFGGADAPLSLGPNSGGQMEGSMGFSSQSEGIDAWFAVEPAGALALQLNFVKENVRKRPLDAPGGLGRQGALRKRKGEVHEMNGHKFVQRQFYQLMLCAFCNDFLLNALGYQCEDCRYTCHKKCYEKVVTKCISKSNTGEGDEEKINHRIPHRFEPLTNMGANWCCHCGYMLPLGRKNARKCSECDITCHANCAHLVPDFCGMSMETANQLLRDWRDINRARGGKAAAPARPFTHTHTPQTQPQPLPPTDVPISQSMDRLQLTGGEVPSPVPATDPYGRRTPTQDGGVDPRFFQQPPPSNVPPRPPPGARVPVPPAYPNEPLLPPAVSQGSIGYDQVGGQDGYSIPPPQKQPGYPQQGLPPKAPPGQAPYAQRPQQAEIVPAAQAMPPAQRQPTRKRKVGLDDFNFLAVLGKGNFGKVMLAEEKKTNGLYAIKVLKKEFIIDNDEVESTRSEKRVFLAAARERHPFLLGLHSCFQTETRVYFVMEYVSGGDLMLHIQRKQFSLRQAKFYASEVLLALEYFHANDIVYRDLKLDNILLTLDGHVKVADYGLCKEGMGFGDTTSTFCGTPEFMAPEILLEQRYGRAVDWWAFGVLTYEMLLGQSPFRGDDEDEIFDAILEDEPLYPITMPRDAVSILQKLLTRDPTRRLGSTKADAEEIKRHPFFKDVNFDDVLNKRIPPPYFPTINGSADTSNFDEEFTKEQPTLTPVHGQLSARDQQEFGGFSWVASWADV